MKFKIFLFIIFLFRFHSIFSQDYELVGLIDNKIVSIDQATGDTKIIIEIENIPNEDVLRDLVYQESKKEFYTIVNPTDNPYIGKISLSGEFQILNTLNASFTEIYTVEAISLFNEEIYFSASLNGGPNENDPYAESLLKINLENKIEFLTEINTEKPYPDIDVLNVIKDKIFIFDGAPPNQNFLAFYELDLNNLPEESYPQNIYNSTYMPIADFTYFNNKILFVENRSLYQFNTTIEKIIDINTENISSNEILKGISQFLPCSLPTINLDNKITTCNQDYIVLDVENENSTYLWSDGSVNSSLTVNKSGTYEVEITNSCGSKKFKVDVKFESHPNDIKIEIEPNSCDSYLLQPKNYNKRYNYLWQGHTTDSIYTVTKTGWYKLIASNDCGTKTDSIFIEIKNYTEILLPNVITPNNDKKNDKFVIDERLQGAEISIYNRYGKLVYQNPRYLNDWDSGNLNSGHYFYQITLDCGDYYKGWIEVIK